MGEMQNTKMTPLGGVAGLVSLVGTIAALNYFGPGRLLPVFGAGVLWVGCQSMGRPAPAFQPAFAVQAVHGAWLAYGVLLVQPWSYELLDPILLGVGVTWMFFRPGLGPVALLSVYQVLSLVVNILSLLSPETNANLVRALLVHIGLRAFALAAMGYAIVRTRREKRLAESTTTDVRAPGND